MNGRKKDIKEIEREGSDAACNAGLPLRSGDCATDRDNRGYRFVRTTGSGGLWEWREWIKGGWMN